MKMSPDEFLDRVYRARGDNALWFDLPADEPPSPVTLADTESGLGARLPDDFRWFLREFGGGDFALSRIYSADPSSDLFILRNQVQSGAGLIAFSDDGTGDAFVFPVEDGTCQDRVLLWDHESGQVREADVGSFLEFLVRVALQSTDG